MKIELMCNFCGAMFQPITGVGDYVRHLIKDHWGLLVKMHDNQEEW
jgi:hypothetical protein